MTTSESKGRFFLQNESIRIDSHNESNRIDSNRELECSSQQSSRAAAAMPCRRQLSRSYSAYADQHEKRDVAVFYNRSPRQQTAAFFGELPSAKQVAAAAAADL